MVISSGKKITYNKADTVTVMIADDHPLVREALKNLIESHSEMKVIAEASDGIEAVMLAKKMMPDIIVMDIGMPGMNGMEATRLIKAQFPDISVLILTVHTDMEHILGILKAGAAGYLTKEVFGIEVIHALQSIASGETVLSPKILQQILGNATDLKTGETVTAHVSSHLNARETYILKLAASGLNNKTIATKLNLSEGTIKSYLNDIFSKLSVSSRTEAVIVGLKAGLINLNDLESNVRA